MPWCDSCDHYLAPNSVLAEGSCPDCDKLVDSGDLKVTKPLKAPWHFWVMVVALVTYLGWRLIDGIVWLIAHF